MNIVCDLETTGVNTLDAEIISGHFIVFDDSFNVVDELTIKSCPRKWSYEAEKIHGISLDQAKTYPPFNYVSGKIVELLLKHKPLVFWCHAKTDNYGKLVYFDHAILRYQLFLISDDAYYFMSRVRPFSTMSLAKMSKNYQFDGYSLNKVCSALNIELNHHDAISDCYASFSIIKRLLPDTTLDDVWDFEKGVQNERLSSPSKPSRKQPRKKESAFRQF